MTEVPKLCADCRFYAVINAASGAGVCTHLKTPEEQKRSFCNDYEYDTRDNRKKVKRDGQ